MKYKKKSASALAFIVLLTILLTACAAVLDPTNDSGDTWQAVQYGIETTEDEYLLQALSVKDVYSNGQVFDAIPEGFTSSFQDKVTTLIIPDARKGETTVDICTGSTAWQNSNIIFLNSLPEGNFYLYGYNNAEYPGYGLMLDVGKNQTIYSFPYRYMTNTALAPDIGSSKDGEEIYVSLHTGIGTGVSISELYVFQMNHIATPYYLDINNLVNSLNEKLSMLYNPETKTVTVFWVGNQIAESELSVIGVNPDTEIVPESFYCGNHIDYMFEGNAIKLIFESSVCTISQPGAQGSLKNISNFESEISFNYNDEGNIVDFNLGEIEAK